MAALVLLIGAIGLLLTRPREALTLAGMLLLSGLIYDRPAAMVALAGVVLLACLIAKAIERIGQRRFADPGGMPTNTVASEDPDRP